MFMKFVFFNTSGVLGFSKERQLVVKDNCKFYYVKQFLLFYLLISKFAIGPEKASERSM